MQKSGAIQGWFWRMLIGVIVSKIGGTFNIDKSYIYIYSD